jgi:hypothetical protein
MFSDKRGYAVYSILDFRYANAGSLWPPINQSMYISELNDAYVRPFDSNRLMRLITKPDGDKFEKLPRSDSRIRFD